MKYYIKSTDGGYDAYIYFNNNCKASVTTAKNKASMFDKDKANNLVKNLPRTLRIRDWNVVSDEEESDLCDGDLKDVCEEEYDDKFISSIQEKICDLENFVIKAYSQRKAVLSVLNVTEAEIQDIEHAIEFYDLNACQGFMIYKKLQDARKKRRECKDAIIILDKFLSCDCTDFLNHANSDVINNMKNRKYEPRICPELFCKT